MRFGDFIGQSGQGGKGSAGPNAPRGAQKTAETEGSESWAAQCQPFRCVWRRAFPAWSKAARGCNLGTPCYCRVSGWISAPQPAKMRRAKKKGRDKARPKSNREVEGDARLDTFRPLSLIYGQSVNASRENRSRAGHACYALRLCLGSTLGCFTTFLASVCENFFLDEITKHRDAAR